MLIKSSFQTLADLLSNSYQHQGTACWKMMMAWGKKIFYECVACICLTIGTIFWLLRFLWQLRS